MTPRWSLFYTGQTSVEIWDRVARLFQVPPLTAETILYHVSVPVPSHLAFSFQYTLTIFTYVIWLALNNLFFEQAPMSYFSILGRARYRLLLLLEADYEHLGSWTFYHLWR